MTTVEKEKTKVLCVDDEPQVLQGLALHLRRSYEVALATSGQDGLDAVAEQGPFGVVLSDMRMPTMNGATFLGKVRQAAPDTTRMLLTGHTDLDAAIASVNEGQIFRFLTKPCPPAQLLLAFEAAAEQHRLVTAERVLLEETLHGSIKALADILSMTNPIAFGRAMRTKQIVVELAEALELQERWPVEVAAMLSQIGAVFLPEETAERFFYGQELDDNEKEMVDRIPKATEELLANIPRLEPVREILAKQRSRLTMDRAIYEKEIPVGARILKIALDLDELESGGFTVQHALDTMRGRDGWYDPKILASLVKLKGTRAELSKIREIPLRAVKVGMIFAEDVRTSSGILLVTRGYEVTQSFVERMRNIRAATVNEPLRIIAV